MGTRTAPLLSTAAIYDQISVKWIDASGDTRSDSFNVLPATTAAEVEALLTDLQDRSNASIYEVTRKSIWTGAKTRTNGTALGRSQSVHDHVLTTYKDLATQASQRVYIPAPLEVTLVDGTDVPNMVDLIDVGLTTVVMLGGNYAMQSARFVEKREINEIAQP